LSFCQDQRLVEPPFPHWRLLSSQTELLACQALPLEWPCSLIGVAEHEQYREGEARLSLTYLPHFEPLVLLEALCELVSLCLQG
jgi:hypothetical protein